MIEGPDTPDGQLPAGTGSASSSVPTTLWGQIDQEQRDTVRLGTNDLPQPSHTLLLSERAMRFIPAFAAFASTKPEAESLQGGVLQATLKSPDQQHPLYENASNFYELAPLHGQDHDPTLNYTFTDGHLRRERPQATAGAIALGSGSDPAGYWTRDPHD